MINVSPQSAFSTSTFYDRRNNRYNVPCEGPKVVPVTINSTASDLNFAIDFTQLFNRGVVSSIQMLSYTLVDSTSNFFSMYDPTTGWEITSSGQSLSGTILVVPVVTTTQPKLYGAIGSINVSVLFNFYNFLIPEIFGQ